MLVGFLIAVLFSVTGAYVVYIIIVPIFLRKKEREKKSENLETT